jgi:hypothetical protein
VTQDVRGSPASSLARSLSGELKVAAWRLPVMLGSTMNLVIRLTGRCVLGASPPPGHRCRLSPQGTQACPRSDDLVNRKVNVAGLRRVPLLPHEKGDEIDALFQDCHQIGTVHEDRAGAAG